LGLSLKPDGCWLLVGWGLLTDRGLLNDWWLDDRGRLDDWGLLGGASCQ